MGSTMLISLVASIIISAVSVSTVVLISVDLAFRFGFEYFFAPSFFVGLMSTIPGILVPVNSSSSSSGKFQIITTPTIIKTKIMRMLFPRQPKQPRFFFLGGFEIGGGTGAD